MDIAVIGAVGVIVGFFITALSGLIRDWFLNKSQKKLDKQRKDILKTLLLQKNWMKIETLSSVIGAGEEETKRLLIDIKARGSLNENDVWALMEKKPLSDNL